MTTAANSFMEKIHDRMPVRGEFQISPDFGGLRAAVPFFMRDLIVLIVHLITTVFRLVQPGGVRAIVAESVLTKHQLLILNRPRCRAPNLRILDRLIAGFCSLWIKPCRFGRVAIAFKPSTLLNFHRAGTEKVSSAVFAKALGQAWTKRSNGRFDPGSH
jgi:hypothetical protein